MPVAVTSEYVDELVVCVWGWGEGESGVGRGSGPVATCSGGGVDVNNEYSLRGTVTGGFGVRLGAASGFAPGGACVRSGQGRVRECFYYFCLL